MTVKPGLLAGMMSFFTPEGLCVPATVVALEPGNVVTMIKTDETDGYNAVQTGYRIVKERKVKKPELGHLKKAGCEPMKHLREWKVGGTIIRTGRMQHAPSALHLTA